MYWKCFHLDISINNGINTSVFIEYTNFSSNTRASYRIIFGNYSNSIELKQVIVSGNSGGLDQSYISGVSLTSQSYIGSVSVVVSLSLFKNNVSIALSMHGTANLATIILRNSSFVNNTPNINYYQSSGIVFIKPGDRGKYVRVTFSDVHFSHNNYKGVMVAQSTFSTPINNVIICFPTVPF